MTRVVCPSCKTGFEARINREDYAINCVTCGVAFNAARFLAQHDFQALAEKRVATIQELRKERVARVLGNVIRPIESPEAEEAEEPDPLQPKTRTGALPFAEEAPSARVAPAPEDAQKPSQTAPASHGPVSFFEACITTSRFQTLSQREVEAQERSPQGRSPVPARGPSRIPAGKEVSTSCRELGKDPAATPGRPIYTPLVAPKGPEGSGLLTGARAGASQAQSPEPVTAPPPPREPFNRESDSTTSAPPQEPEEAQGAPSSQNRHQRHPLVEGTFGPFEIVSEIARGGVGAVFRARERGTDREVALKVLLDGEEAGELERERFRRECETAKALALPGMVEIYLVGEVEGKPYMAMELVEGSSLDKLVKQKKLSVNDTLLIMQGVAQTVGALHEAGYVHRDLKPANILLDTYGAPKVADFGLVKSLDEVTRLTASGLVCGTPAYMSPEQAKGDSDQIDPRSDVWALGAVLYELLAGRPPFRAENALRLMHKITQETPESLQGFNPLVPREVQLIVQKCLEKNPQRRYQNARFLAQDIGRFLEGKPIEARTRSVKALLGAARRNRALWLPAGLVAAAVLLAAILIHWLWKGDSVEPLLVQGWTALREQRLAEAEADFRRAVERAPTEARCQLGLGLALGAQGIDFSRKMLRNESKFKEAVLAFETAGRLDPAQAAQADEHLARLYRCIKRYQIAAQLLKRAIDREGSNPEYSQALGLVYWHLLNETSDPRYCELALKAFQRVLALQPTFPNTDGYIRELQQRASGFSTAGLGPRAG